MTFSAFQNVFRRRAQKLSLRTSLKEKKPAMQNSTFHDFEPPVTSVQIIKLNQIFIVCIGYLGNGYFKRWSQIRSISFEVIATLFLSKAYYPYSHLLFSFFAQELYYDFYLNLFAKWLQILWTIIVVPLPCSNMGWAQTKLHLFKRRLLTLSNSRIKA